MHRHVTWKDKKQRHCNENNLIIGDLLEVGLLHPDNLVNSAIILTRIKRSKIDLPEL